MYRLHYSHISLYTEFNSNEIPIHSSLESSLWINLPCETQHKSERQSKREWKRVRGWQICLPGSQPCDHPSGWPDRQHALVLFRGQHPTPLLICASQRLCWRELRASGGLCRWLSNRRYGVVTGSCCLSEDLSFTWAENILLAFSELKILQLENSLVCGPEVFHMC